jgi:glutaredoxin
MKSNLPYQLFISSKCSCCEEVLSYLKTKNITLTITNVDKDKYVLPFSVLLFPALVLGNKLIGYGFEDIVAKLKTN